VTGWREKKETKKKKFGYFVIKSCWSCLLRCWE
jgi:hypothetical protein